MGPSNSKPVTISVAALMLTMALVAVPAQAIAPIADFEMSPDPLTSLVDDRTTITVTSTSHTCVDAGTCTGTESIEEERWRVFFMTDTSPDDVQPDSGPIEILDVTFTGADVPGSSITLGPPGSGADAEVHDDGEYRIRLDVTDDDGETDFIRSNDMSGDGSDFELVNVRPVSSFTVSSDDDPISSLSTIDLDGSASSDVDGNVVQWRWIIRLVEDPTPDGEHDAPGIIEDVTDNDPFYSTSVPDDGTYRIILRVTDDDGDVGGSNQLLEVVNLAPDAPMVNVNPEPPNIYQPFENVRFNDLSPDAGLGDPDGTVDRFAVFSESEGFLGNDEPGGLVVHQFQAHYCQEELTFVNVDDDEARTSTTETITVDGIAPVTTPSALPATGPLGWYEAPLEIDFETEDECTDVIGNEVILNGDVSHPSGDYTVTIEDAGTHDLSVRAQDAANNLETPLTFTLPVDNTTAEVSLETPCLVLPGVECLVGGAFVAGDTVAIEANATDEDSDVATVDFFVDDEQVGTDSTAPYTFDWAAEGGLHTIEVVATNGAGMTSSDSTQVLVLG